jgi:hypothetical protein
MSVVRTVLAVLLPAASSPVHAASINTTPLTSTQKNTETLGTGVAVAPPLTAEGVTLYENNTMGFAQLTAETPFTAVTAYAFKNIFHEERPNGSDDQSFPSATSALASSGSSFFWGRYGWEYGLPAFALSQFVSYSRASMLLIVT